MASEINVDKITPQTGTTLTLGDNGDTITVTGTLDGSGLTGLNATNLTSGTVPDARFPATLPAASGVNLTNLDASDLASGTVPNARFPATLPALNGSALTNLTSGNLTGALPAIDGSALTGISGGTNTPSFHVYASSGQTVTGGGQTKVVFNTEVVDTDNAFATNTFTVPSGKGGKYLMYACVHNSNRQPARYHVQIRQNNSEKLTLENGNGGANAGVHVSGLVDASAGDTFDVYYYNTEGSNMTIDGGISKMFFGGFKLL